MTSNKLYTVLKSLGLAHQLLKVMKIKGSFTPLFLFMSLKDFCIQKCLV